MYAAPCRLERRQSSSRMSQESDRDSERRELRIWMRRRQREQLAVYQRHRESLRERERQPFSRMTVRRLYLFTFISALSFLYIVSSFFICSLCCVSTDATKQTSNGLLEVQRTKRKVHTSLCCLSMSDVHHQTI